MDAERVTAVVIGDAIAVHRELGPGLLESTYEACLTALLRGRGLRVERQVALPVVFRGQPLERAYRVDLRVECCVIVEVAPAASRHPLDNKSPHPEKNARPARNARSTR